MGIQQSFKTFGSVSIVAASNTNAIMKTTNDTTIVGAIGLNPVQATSIQGAFVEAKPIANGPQTRVSFGFTDSTRATQLMTAPTTTLGLTAENSSVTYGFDIETIQSSVVSTYAGNGSATFADGSAATASFNFPQSIAFDTNGTMYVVDSNNNRIRMITSAGVVSTFITNPLLNGPSSMAFDSSGNIYISNTNRHQILKYSNGVLSLFAGSPTGEWAGVVDGTGSSVRFQSPVGIAVHPNGNIIVVDSGNRCLRSITPGGVVSALPVSGASYNWPSNIAIDSNGMMYVTNTSFHHILKVTPAGAATIFAGSTGGISGFADGIGTSAIFNAPRGITIDSANNLYISEIVSQRIRKITPAGVVTTIAGSGASTPFINGYSMNATFNQPYGIAVDKTGNLYVADFNNHRIRLISSISSQTGTDSSLLRLIKAGNIVNVDEPFTNNQVFVSGNDQLLLTLDQSGYKYFVNNILVGRSPITTTTPNNTHCFITAIQNQTGISTATTIRQAGITNIIVGQYNTSTGYDAAPLLLGGSRPVNIKPLNTKATSFKVIRKKRTSGKTAVKRR